MLTLDCFIAFPWTVEHFELYTAQMAQCCSIHSKPVISAFRDVAPSTPRKEDSCILSMVASASVTVHVVVQSGPWCQTTTNIIKRQTSRASQQSNLKNLERSNETLGPMLPDVPTPKTACKMSIPWNYRHLYPLFYKHLKHMLIFWHLPQKHPQSLKNWIHGNNEASRSLWLRPDRRGENWRGRLCNFVCDLCVICL